MLQKKDWKDLSLDEKKAGASRVLLLPSSVLRPVICPSLDRRALSCLFFFWSPAMSACAHARSAAYYVAFGPHGPRAPVNPPGTNTKVFFGVAALIAAAGVTYSAVRQFGQDAPRFARLVALANRPMAGRVRRWCPAKDNHKRMGGGRERALQGAQNQPYHWCVCRQFCISHHTLSASLLRRYLVGRILRQGLRHAQVTRGRPLFGLELERGAGGDVTRACPYIALRINYTACFALLLFFVPLGFDNASRIVSPLSTRRTCVSGALGATARHW